MVPLQYLSAFLGSLVIPSLAEIVSLRSASRALAERLNSPNEFRFLPPIPPTLGSDSNSDELELMDVVLLASVDGKFHALNRTSGHTLWSMASTSVSSPVPSTLGPLVRTSHVDSDPDLTDDDALHQELYVIEPQSGDIYVMNSPSSPLQRMPFSMSQLVDMSPFSFAGGEDRRLFVGKKETSLLLIELETGKVKATLNSECPWDPFEDLNDQSEVEDLDLDELDGTKPSRQVSKPTEIFIGRTDYHISIHTRPLSSSSKPPIQNLSFSSYGPNNQDNTLQTVYRRTRDDAYIQSLPSGEIISFKARGETVTTDSQVLWMRAFKSPIVAVFDVLTSPTRHQPFVLIQPHPQVNVPAAAKANNLPNIESAYVGIVEETGSLFAMTPDQFPLVAFGDTGNAEGGRRLIDPPPGNVDLPSDVDSVTKARKARELCRNGSPDRRCLTGVRRLEASSRLGRWLLDGVPTVPLPPLPKGEVADLGFADEIVGGVDNSSTSFFLPGVWPSSGNWSKGTLEASANVSAFVSFAFALFLWVLWIVAKKINKKNGMNPLEEVHMDNVGGDQILSSGLPRDAAVVGPIQRNPALDEPETISLTSSPASSIKTSSVSMGIASTPTDIPKISNGDADPLNDGGDGEESDREGDGAVPGKRKYRRGKRGKKKKLIILSPDNAEDVNTGLLDGNATAKEKVEAIIPTSPLSIVTTPTLKSTATSPSLVVSDTVLGFGSHGTVVFQGSLQGRAVAVKRLLQDFVTLASREVSILQESDDHPNVIRYYYQESHGNFLYIALELCPASLADVIESPNQFRDIYVAFEPKRALRQITSGLRHLHALKLVHRDIKPQNILISNPKGSGSSAGHRMLISDFGLCKKLDVDQTSFLPTAHGAVAAGTFGWRAPEILRGDVKLDESLGDDQSQSSRGSVGTPTSSNGKPTRLTKSVDIFALGCLFYYALTNGGHPFGDRFEREVNILKNAKSLDKLSSFGEEGSEAVDLINSMLDPEAYRRPDTTTCLLHPFFWDPGRRLTFLQDASDRFEIMCRDPRDDNLVVLETDAVSIVGSDWHSRLDRIFIENLGKFRKYDGRSVQDLLRALRNKKHHYQDLPDNVKRHLGPMPEGFLAYFTRRYPRLFLHVHSVVAGTSLRHESMFKSYFDLSSD